MKKDDAQLIWEQFTSPGRTGGGNIPFADGRGEMQDPKVGAPDTNPARQRSNAEVQEEGERMRQLFEDYYHDLIDKHGATPASTSYTGLEPGPDDSEALQFLNVLVYIADILSPEKLEILKSMVALKNTGDHVNVAYSLSQMSAEELNKLLDGGSLPF